MPNATKAQNTGNSETRFPSSSLITYEQDGVLILGVVIGSKKDKFVVYNDRGRELELPAIRLYRLPGNMPGDCATFEEKGDHLSKIFHEAAELSLGINLEEIWLFIQEEAREYTNKELCELYFGNNNLLSHLGLRLALLSDNKFFKRNKETFGPRTPEVVEELKKAQAAKERKGDLQRRAIECIGKRLKDPAALIPDEIEPVLNTIAELAALSPHLDHSHQKEALTFLESVLEEFNLEYSGQAEKKAYELLVALGVFSRKTNLCVIRHRPPMRFSEAALKLANSVNVPEEISSYDTSGQFKRRDFTMLDTFTIDDATTKDMDDALSIERLENGYRIYVHVSDVASFVPMGSALDEEAMHRGTSIYLPDQRIHMIPDGLSEEKLSLVAGIIRPAMTCIFDMSSSFDLGFSEVCLSLIKVQNRYTYDEVDEMIKAKDPTFGLLDQIASHLKATRNSRGASQVIKRDVFLYVEEDGTVTLREFNEESPARSLIGEMAILANEFIGKFCYEHSLPIPYRGQEASDPDDGTLAKIPEGPARDFASKQKLKRSETSFSPVRHAGLGLDVYTQATSPIRRYLDLCVQRQVSFFLQNGKPALSHSDLENINNAVQENLALANVVTRESKKYWILRYLEQRMQKKPKIRGTVVRLDSRNPLVELDEVYITLPVRFNNNPKLGDEVELKICSVDPLSDYIRLDPVNGKK